MDAAFAIPSIYLKTCRLSKIPEFLSGEDRDGTDGDSANNIDEIMDSESHGGEENGHRQRCQGYTQPAKSPQGISA